MKNKFIFFFIQINILQSYNEYRKKISEIAFIALKRFIIELQNFIKLINKSTSDDRLHKLLITNVITWLLYLYI